MARQEESWFIHHLDRARGFVAINNEWIVGRDDPIASVTRDPHRKRNNKPFPFVSSQQCFCQECPNCVYSVVERHGIFLNWDSFSDGLHSTHRCNTKQQEKIHLGDKRVVRREERNNWWCMTYKTWINSSERLQVSRSATSRSPPNGGSHRKNTHSQFFNQSLSSSGSLLLDPSEQTRKRILSLYYSHLLRVVEDNTRRSPLRYCDSS